MTLSELERKKQIYSNLHGITIWLNLILAILGAATTPIIFPIFLTINMICSLSFFYKWWTYRKKIRVLEEEEYVKNQRDEFLRSVGAVNLQSN